MAFLDALESVRQEDTSFHEAISRILSIFRFSNYISNILSVVDKSDKDSETTNLMEDGVVRRITTVGNHAMNRVFLDEVSEDFEEAAKTAQDALMDQGILNERIEYKLADGLAYNRYLFLKGRSGGLAMAYLAYSWQMQKDNRLLSYIAICGSIDRSYFVGRVEGIEKKLKSAKNNGIRVIFIPKSNTEDLYDVDLDEYSGLVIIDYSDGHISEVIGFLEKEMENLRLKIQKKKIEKGKVGVLDFDSIKEDMKEISDLSIVLNSYGHADRLIERTQLFRKAVRIMTNDAIPGTDEYNNVVAELEGDAAYIYLKISNSRDQKVSIIKDVYEVNKERIADEIAARLDESLFGAENMDDAMKRVAYAFEPVFAEGLYVSQEEADREMKRYLKTMMPIITKPVRGDPVEVKDSRYREIAAEYIDATEMIGRQRSYVIDRYKIRGLIEDPVAGCILYSVTGPTRSAISYEELVEKMKDIATLSEVLNRLDDAKPSEAADMLDRAARIVAGEDHYSEILREFELSSTAAYSKMKAAIAKKANDIAKDYEANKDRIAADIEAKLSSDLEGAKDEIDAAERVKYVFALLLRIPLPTQAEAEAVQTEEVSKITRIPANMLTQVRGDPEKARDIMYRKAIAEAGYIYKEIGQSGDAVYRVDKGRLDGLIEDPRVGSLLYVNSRP